jgi:glycosyltransferase involved in cell wall biosynthesis
MKKSIVVKGPALSRSGYGEQTRFALRALKAYEEYFDIYLVNTTWGRTGQTAATTPEVEWIHSVLQKTAQAAQNGTLTEPQLSLQVTIPPEFEKIASVNIGYTAGIETTKVSPGWIIKTNENMDKVITTSQHAKNVFEQTRVTVTDQNGTEHPNYGLQRPVETVNYAIKEHVPDPAGLDIAFETNKNFLCVAQWGPRKNLENTISWFIDEFKDDADVGLVLKTNTMSDSLKDREQTVRRLEGLLKSLPDDRKCKIYLVHGEVSPNQLAWLYEHPTMKAMINIAHGEGYGLPLFEAATHGLPLVTVTWSGQLDFICKQNKKGKRVPRVCRVDYELNKVQDFAVWPGVIEADSMWCYAKEGSYKRAIRSILDKEVHYRQEAEALQSHIRETFTEEKIYKQFAETVYGSELTVVEAKDLPKVSLVTSVYRADDYIEQLMEDMTRQTIFEDKCEWIILNANEEGHDVEEEVILKYVEKYPDNIIYKRLEEDPGIYDTWNMGIKMATGEYVTNVNCDDRRAPDGLEKQAKLLYGNPDVDLAYNDSYITHEPNIMWEDINASTAQKYNFEQFSKEAMLRGNLPHNNPMWKKDLHDKFGYFNQDYKSAGDWDFWLRCAFGGATYMKHPDVLGVYYFNPTGMSTNPEHDSWKKEHEREIFQNYLQMYQQQQASQG